jgi:AcrR family transcriptional regulator
VRAAAAEATAERIVRATLELAYERNAIDMTLEQVAARAGTSVQTVLRKFGSRDGLLIAATQAGSQEVVAERQPVPGDRDASIAALVEHYEQRGRFVLRILAQDESWARLITDSGKLVHRAWVEEVFAADLPDAGPQRDELVDLLVVATDVYAWKLLRLDRGLDAATTASRIRTLTLRILAPTP